MTYNDGAALLRCLRSLEAEDDGALEVVVVNNGDDVPELAEAAELSFIRIVSPGSNLGFAAGNNLGARQAAGDVLFFLNPDTVVARGTIAELTRILEDSSIGIVMPRLRLLDEPDRLNSSGNVFHIAGLAWAGGYGDPADAETVLKDVAYPSGAAMALRTEVFRELGGFTDEFFMYQEDLELGWRAHLRGLRVVLTPGADVYHEYDYRSQAPKYYLLERNRLIVVFSAFSLRLLAVVAPLLLAAELGLTAVSLKEGWFMEKAAGWAWCARNLPWLRRHRRATQALRRVSDRDLAHFLTPVVDPRMVGVPAFVRAANPLVKRYWDLARRAL